VSIDDHVATAEVCLQAAAALAVREGTPTSPWPKAISPSGTACWRYSISCARVMNPPCPPACFPLSPLPPEARFDDY
jgi:hypothetical protein